MAVDLLKIFADDKRLVVYRPQWRAITGSVTATILLQQILFHWDKSGQRPFYKFKEPCLDAHGRITHNLYRPGDSWVEELGFSRAEFDTAIKKIGCKLSKRRLRLDPNLKNHGQPVEYYTDEQHLTWYTIHESNFLRVLTNLYAPAQPPAAPPEQLPRAAEAAPDSSGMPCQPGNCPLKRESGVSERRDSAFANVSAPRQEKRDAGDSECRNPAVDLSPESRASKRRNPASDQFTEITTEIRVSSETTAERRPVVFQTVHGPAVRPRSGQSGPGHRPFPDGIEAYIQRITAQYGRLFEYPDNFSDLCRSDEFYGPIRQNPAVLAALADNVHKASKDGEVKNILGWARTATRELLRGGLVGHV